MQQVQSCLAFSFAQAISRGKGSHTFLRLRHTFTRFSFNLVFQQFQKEFVTVIIETPAWRVFSVDSRDIPDLIKNCNWCSRLKQFGLRRRLELRVTPWIRKSKWKCIYIIGKAYLSQGSAIDIHKLGRVRIDTGCKDGSKCPEHKKVATHLSTKAALKQGALCIQLALPDNQNKRNTNHKIWPPPASSIPGVW